MAASELSPCLPPGFQVCPLQPQTDAAVRICLVVRTKADPANGWFVALGESFAARGFLGCLTDQLGNVLYWLQITVQITDAAQTGPEAIGDFWTNHRLDQRWQADCDLATGHLALRGAWESQHPLPLFFDSATRTLAPLTDVESGAVWRLCTDEAVLAAAGLPPYSTSTCRYLYVTPPDDHHRFLAVQDDAPRNESTALLRDIAAAAGRKPWNPAAGLMRIRRWSSLSTDSLLDILAGLPYSGVPGGKQPMDFDRLADILKDTGESLSAGTVFLGRHGRHGRIIESLHLKLKFLADALDCVHRFTRKARRPLLNLQTACFQPHLAAPSAALPFLWTAGLDLVDFGRAATVNIPDSDEIFFTDAGPAAPNAYKPLFDARQLIAESASLRLRSLTAESDGGCLIDGTLSAIESIKSQPADLVCLRVALADQRILLTGFADAHTALAAGELRFRSNRFAAPPDILAALKTAEGTTLRPVRMQCLPRMDSAYDLYALAVLGLRALVVHPKNPLPVAVDVLRSLIARLSADAASDRPLAQRIGELLETDSRWSASLGPANVFPLTDDDSAGDLIPRNLWLQILELLVRMVPGGPESFCASYGIMPPAGMAGLFEPAADTLQRLLIQTRSLIVIDWRVNREVHAVIRRFQLGV